MGTYRPQGHPTLNTVPYLVPWCQGQSHGYLDFSTTLPHPTPTSPLLCTRVIACSLPRAAGL